MDFQDYTRSRLALQQEDDAWIRGAIESQRKALNELKMLKLELYEAAVQPAAKDLPLIVQVAEKLKKNGQKIDEKPEKLTKIH